MQQEMSNAQKIKTLHESNQIKKEDQLSDHGNNEIKLEEQNKIKDEKVQPVDIFKYEQKQQKYPKLAQILDDFWFGIYIAIVTVVSLFISDMFNCLGDASSDLALSIISLIILTTFLFEMFLQIMVKKKYVGSFYFYLDIISTASIILDLHWVNNALSGSTAASQSNDASSIARAARAARIGTKAGRIIRIIRLIRLTKILKLVHQKNQQDKKNQEEADTVDDISQIKQLQQYEIENQNMIKEEKEQKKKNIKLKQRQAIDHTNKDQQIELKELEELQNESESRIGQKLSEIITIRVIILVLSLIMIVPLFDDGYYFDLENDMLVHINTLQTLASSTDSNLNNQANLQSQFNLIIQINDNTNKIYSPSKVSDQPLIYLQFENPTYTQTPYTKNYGDLRISEINKLSSTYNFNGKSYTIISQTSARQDNINQSIINICRTIYVAIVLVIGSMIFSQDVNRIALEPIERMIKKVNQIATNPLSSKDQELQNINQKDSNEVLIIENAITKIGILLALGFGEAGSSIIGKNMAKQGDLDPMLPGQRQCAIFGFCDIRNFTDATEILQEEVMVFVNTIAQVVHKVIDIYQGSANKNIGDAFLLVWKIPEGSEHVKLLDDGNYVLQKTKPVQNICDFSLFSFLKIIALLNRKEKILAYRKHPLLNQHMPNFKIKMGFGLHVGWAIEGAIGSVYKIDASYLSPNVNMAARLEAATKQYGVPLLLTNILYEACSRKTKKICREIDRVTVKGSLQPIGLFTVDVCLDNIKPSAKLKMNKRTKQEKSEELKSLKSVFKQFLNKDCQDDINTLLEQDEDEDLYLLCQNVNLPYRQVFEQGFKNYIDGKWESAKEQFEMTIQLRPEEEPSKTLLGVLKDHHYKAPADWQGYRALTDK